MKWRKTQGSLSRRQVPDWQRGRRRACKWRLPLFERPLPLLTGRPTGEQTSPVPNPSLFSSIPFSSTPLSSTRLSGTLNARAGFLPGAGG